LVIFYNILNLLKTAYIHYFRKNGFDTFSRQIDDNLQVFIE